MKQTPKRISYIRPDPDAKWPFGYQVQECPECHGSGMDKVKKDLYLASRQLNTSDALPDIQCCTCEGRGRVIIPNSKQANDRPAPQLVIPDRSAPVVHLSLDDED